jgi:hypothetical protein
VCPARLAATWETASADVGSNACDVVDVLLYSQAQVQSEIAAEIEAGTFGYSITAETVVDETVVDASGGGFFDSSSGSEDGSETFVDSSSGSEDGSETFVEDPVSAASPTFSVSILVLASALVCFFA